MEEIQGIINQSSDLDDLINMSIYNYVEDIDYDITKFNKKYEYLHKIDYEFFINKDKNICYNILRSNLIINIRKINWKNDNDYDVMIMIIKFYNKWYLIFKNLKNIK